MGGERSVDGGGDDAAGSSNNGTDADELEPDAGPHGSVDAAADAGCAVDCTMPAGSLETSGTTFVESRPVEMGYSGVEGVVMAFVALYSESADEPLERHTVELPKDAPATGRYSFGPLQPGTYRIRLVASGTILDEVTIQVVADSDDDGVPDTVDGCPLDPAKTQAGRCGCGESEKDSDGDGEPDCLDRCLNDRDKTTPGACGCGVPDADRDGDARPDCEDRCPTDPAKVEPGQCGCGVADTDTDTDRTADCVDACPEDPRKTRAGLCGCGTPEDSCTSPTLYEAEDASTLQDATRASNHEGYTGTGYADYGGMGSFVAWDGVDGGPGGVFRLDLRYALVASSRSCDVLVDGVRVTSAAFRGTGSWTSWSVESLEIPLTAGLHTIRIEAHSTSGGPNLDHMVVTFVAQN